MLHYTLTHKIINMPNYRIVDYVVGACGSNHNSSVFVLSSIAQDPSRFLRIGEWIWADTAYRLYDWCLVPFKRPQSEQRENRDYNYYLSRVCISPLFGQFLICSLPVYQVCIKSEHCIGYLKGRWSSLRGLNQQIGDQRAQELASLWVRSCLILHNLIISFEVSIDEDAPWYRTILEEGREADRLYRDVDAGVGGTTAGQRKRVELKNELLQALGRNE